MKQNKAREIAHDSHIKDNAEFFWGWSTPAGKLRAERRSRLIIERLKEESFSKVLEIGAGTGIFTEFFCKAGLDIYCLDISFDLLEKTRMKCQGPFALKLNVADAANLPYADESFDAAVGVCVLHHLDIIPVLKEIKRVIKKGGVIIFSEPNMMNPQLMLQKNIKPIKRLKILGETEDETAFFRWAIKKTLEGMGFKDIAITPFDFLHPWTPKPLISLVSNLGAVLEHVPLIREIAGSLLIYAVKED